MKNDSIIGAIPPGLLRRSIIVSALTVIIVLLGSSIIRIPEVIRASAIIYPADSTAVVEVPRSSLTKMHAGLKVNIKLDSYPYEQYGVLAGTLGTREETTDSTVRMPVCLWNGLKTSYGKTVPADSCIDGTAEIMTEGKSLLLHCLK
ncbi:MAG: hypothetical protein LKK19_06845 [Bacteroidales bacterium]|jgi:hypothetical protein|nr:hypothetical protein [Bacteroidales bacterium]MCI2122401.1 hypothetical protein [Bacteroidales bacterium]MCI2145889.1 hypothetical protein [Bacteroidales bacterium]